MESFFETKSRGTNKPSHSNSALREAETINYSMQVNELTSVLQQLQTIPFPCL